MSSTPKSPQAKAGKTGNKTEQERLAKALRQNLLRRKAAAITKKS